MEFLCGSCQALDDYTVYLTPRQLRELCALSGDRTSLAIGMAGIVMTLTGYNCHREAAQLSSELAATSVTLAPRAAAIRASA